MVVIGVDAHKRTHTFAVVDEMGRELANRTFAATPDGHLAALDWAWRWPVDGVFTRLWGSRVGDPSRRPRSGRPAPSQRRMAAGAFGRGASGSAAFRSPSYPRIALTLWHSPV
jgi:hypothetical protein